MWVYDLKTLRFLDVNPAAVKLYGYSRAEFLKMKVSDITYQDHPPDQKVKRNGYRNSGKTIHCRKNGAPFHVQLSSKEVSYNGYKAALVEIKNVIKDEPAEPYFKSLLDDAPDAIVVINSNGKITLVNKQTERLFGYTRDEILGRGIENLIPKRFRSVHRGHRLDYFDQPRVRPMGTGLELRGLTRDGTEFPV